MWLHTVRKSFHNAIGIGVNVYFQWSFTCRLWKKQSSTSTLQSIPYQKPLKYRKLLLALTYTQTDKLLFIQPDLIRPMFLQPDVVPANEVKLEVRSAVLNRLVLWLANIALSCSGKRLTWKAWCHSWSERRVSIPIALSLRWSGWKRCFLMIGGTEDHPSWVSLLVSIVPVASSLLIDLALRQGKAKASQGRLTSFFGPVVTKPSGTKKRKAEEEKKKAAPKRRK